MKNLKKIKGDASNRKFYRKKYNNYKSILIYAKENKTKNLLVYDAINKILNKNSILAPSLYSEKYDLGYLEIQDFGNDTVFKIIRKNKNKKLFYFNKIIKLLNQIQSIKDRKVKNFKKNIYLIPEYKKKILIEEANLFCKWYVKKKQKEIYKKI